MKTFIQLTTLLLFMLLNACIIDVDDAEETSGPTIQSVDSSGTSSSDELSSTSNANLYAYYIAGEFGGAGEIRAIDLESKTVTNLNISIDQDSRIIANGTDVYVLERGVANILKLDATTDTIVYQQSLEADANPQDFELVNSTKAYVSYNSIAKVVVVNPKTGIVDSYIDLSEYAVAGATSPFASDIELVDGKLYVALQRFDAMYNADTAKVVVIDVETDVVESVINLSTKNPVDIWIEGTYLFSASNGTAVYDVNWNAISGNDGAIEKIDLITGTSTIVLTEEQLGGKPASMVGDVVIKKSGNEYYIVVAGEWPNQNIKIVDLALESVVKTLENTNAVGGGMFYYASADLLILGEQDQTLSGITLFENDVLTDGPIGSTFNSPNSLTLVIK